MLKIPMVARRSQVHRTAGHNKKTPPPTLSKLDRGRGEHSQYAT